MGLRILIQRPPDGRRAWSNQQPIARHTSTHHRARRTGDITERSALPQRLSRALHFVGDLTARASAVVVISLAVAIFVIVSAFNSFPTKWQIVFATIAESIALIMLFVIQHTQSRQQVVLQLKLDELIRASPNADDLLVHLEVAQDSELIEREQDQVAHHESLRESSEDDA